MPEVDALLASETFAGPIDASNRAEARRALQFPYAFFHRKGHPQEVGALWASKRERDRFNCLLDLSRLVASLKWNQPATMRPRPISLTIMHLLGACLLLSRQVVDPILGSRERTLLRRFGYRGPHRVQVDIRCACEQRRFIEQQLALVSTFPEMARAAILPIGAPSDMLRRAPHPPTDIRQSPTAFGKHIRLVHDHRNFRLPRFGRRTVFLAARGE